MGLKGLINYRDRLRCAQPALGGCAGAHAAETQLCSNDGDFSMTSKLLTKKR